MEISSTRKVVSAESTHETKTTQPLLAGPSIMSDNVNLLDINIKAKARRLNRIIAIISAAFFCAVDKRGESVESESR
ncbi:MAG: hypothetical protein DCO81_06945 [Candidatus Aquiluna sp. XM-24bin5]|nr:MAG: hypothetical protein DCO81_06945 [Candidatus Aquiluna sp. XM-24bin5]